MNVKVGTLMFIVLCGSSIGAFPQSSFHFGNYIGPGGLDAPVFNADGTRLFGSNFVAMLYGGPTTNTLVHALDRIGEPLAPVPFTFVPNGQAGYFHAQYAEIPNVFCGVYTWLQVRAWDVRLGGTYEEVAALGSGGYGESTLFNELGGAPCLLPPGTPAVLYGLQSFSLRAVPEPSTWALLVLGGLGAGWAIRRRNGKGRSI